MRSFCTNYWSNKYQKHRKGAKIMWLENLLSQKFFQYEKFSYVHYMYNYEGIYFSSLPIVSTVNWEIFVIKNSLRQPFLMKFKHAKYFIRWIFLITMYVHICMCIVFFIYANFFTRTEKIIIVRKNLTSEIFDQQEFPFLRYEHYIE